ncbi:MAG TPA: alpha/beta fold hydrolase [Gemmatimonadales bacterium]|jgi:dienelactone hydrolase
MATAVLTHQDLPGALGPILIDVRSTVRPSTQPAVLLVHGFRGFKDYGLLTAMAERLARAGFTAVTLSVSGSGVDAAGEFAFPERFARNSYTREFADIELVIATLMAGGLGSGVPRSLGVIGHSRGGGVALCVTRETPAIDAVVTWSAISTIRRYTDAEVEAWRRAERIYTETRDGIRLPMDYEIVEDALAHADRFDIELAAATLARPWLLVQGTADDVVSLAEGERLAARATDPRFASLFIAGANHSYGAAHPWAGTTAASETLFGETVRYLTRHLG